MTPLDRLLITLGTAVALLVVGYALRAAWRSRVLLRLRASNPARSFDTHAPTLHYFWSEGCAPCKVQEAQIEEVRRTLAAVGATVLIARHNALEETALVKEMRVVTVPTTVVIGGNGRIVAWNPGFTGSRVLLQQIQTLVSSSPPAGSLSQNRTLGSRLAPVAFNE
jgi:hypothetical protein